MNNDWFADLKEFEALEALLGQSDDEKKENLAKSDPEAWLREQLENDSDQAYTCIDSRHYRAVSVKNGIYVKTEVELSEEDFLVIRVLSDIVATEDTENEFRLYQMFENATFKTAGYLPAKAGDPITFEVRLRPSGYLNVGKMVKQGAISIAVHNEKLSHIRKGIPAKTICHRAHLGMIEAAIGNLDL